MALKNERGGGGVLAHADSRVGDCRGRESDSPPASLVSDLFQDVGATAQI